MHHDDRRYANLAFGVTAGATTAFGVGRAKVAAIGEPVPSVAVPALSSLIDFVKSDIAKLLRFAAVSVVSVPFGLLFFWIFLEVFDMRPVIGNIASASIMAFPNYLMNRYWVWEKKGANSVKREIAPFWMMALLGALLSTFMVWIAERFTDSTLVFLAANFCAFGIVWVLKFFVLEKYLFGESTASPVEVRA